MDSVGQKVDDLLPFCSKSEVRLLQADFIAPTQAAHTLL